MIVVCSYPKSGLHLARALLRESGYESTHTHNGPMSGDTRARRPDLHVVRDIRDVVVSAVCYFVLERPELDAEAIRPHVMDVSKMLVAPWRHAPGARSWSHYVTEISARAQLTITYRDLVERPRDALLSLGVGVTEAAVARVAAARSWEGQAFRRGAPGGWRDVLSPEQAEEIAGMHAEGLAALAAQEQACG